MNDLLRAVKLQPNLEVIIETIPRAHMPALESANKFRDRSPAWPGSGGTLSRRRPAGRSTSARSLAIGR